MTDPHSDKHPDTHADPRPDPHADLHPEPGSSTGTSAGSLPSPGRAFALYSVLRLLLLLVAFVVLRLVLGPDNGLLVIGGAVLLSALLSLVLLRRQRDAFTSASIARADRRRAERAARQARLDEGRSDL